MRFATNMFVLTISLLIPAASFGEDASSTAAAGTLRVTVTGIESAEGTVRLALFDSEETFTREAVEGGLVPAAESSVVWELEGLAPGEYGIAVHHDLNDNGKMDTRIFGIPKEPYGFSNNVRGRMGPPKWKLAKFVHGSGETVLEIEVR